LKGRFEAAHWGVVALEKVEVREMVEMLAS